MKHLESALPKRAKGGSRIGWSSISLFQECEISWYYQNLVPHPKGGFGVGSGDVRPLWVGQRVHDALAAWFLSAPETAQYDADAGFEAIETEAKASGLADRDADSYAAWSEEATQIFKRYAIECGPRGPDPDGDRFRIAADAEGWLVERDFEVDLGWGGFYFTSRIDTVGWDVTTANKLLVVEHKTCDVSRVGSALRGYALDPQLSGEALAVSSAWGTPVVPVINMMKKRAAAKANYRTWDPMPRTDEDLQKFRLDTIRTLKRMDERVEEYREMVDAGVPPLTAGNMVFHGSPKGKICADQGRQCFAYEACFRRANRDSWLRTTEPKFTVEEVTK